MLKKAEDILIEDYIEAIPESSKFQHPELVNAAKALLEHDSGYSWTNLFEKKFAEKMKVKHAIAVNSGTSGLHAALYAADVKENDEVINGCICCHTPRGSTSFC